MTDGHDDQGRYAGVRVASAPHGHVYIRHLTDPAGSNSVYRLPDPAPTHPVPGAPWWPLVMLDVAWINAHAHEFDVFHLHFGFDAVDPTELARIVAALRAHHKPLVYTVHDLRNPHQLDPALHDAALDVLIPAAHQLITLTPGAAQEILGRWGRNATVVPHPHIVPLEVLHRPRPVREGLTVGLHLKSMRTNMNPLPLLDVLLREIHDRHLTLVVDVHTDVVTPGATHFDPRVRHLLDTLRQREDVRVHVHDFYSDEDLWDYFMSLDLSVLAYRFGTHSGWLEACYDLGTRVLAPSVGYYHQQHPGVLSFDWDQHGVPEVGQIRAALDALPGLAPWRATHEERSEQRRGIARDHARIYQDAVAGRRA